LGTSNGNAFQTFTLKNVPLYKKPGAIDLYEHLKIQVREPSGGGALGGWKNWSRVDEIPKGNGQYYRCDPVTGDITFGNHNPANDEGHGRIPPQDSEIRALNYRHVAGGANGNVSPLTLNVLQNQVPSVISVSNPGAGTGGSDQEAVEDTKRRGPEVLRNRFRAVTLEDNEYLVLESTRDVKIVRALPPRLYEQDVPPNIRAGDPWMYASLNRSPGRVNVIIAPVVSETVARPKPDKELLLEVSEYLNKRRIATALLHVSEPKYLPIDAVVDFRVWQKAIDDGLIVNALEVKERITARIHKFLHPIWGNIDGKGWQVGQHIFLADLFEFIMPDPEIGFIENLRIRAAIPDYHDPVLPWKPAERPFPIDILGVWVQLADYELLCSGTHAVILKGIA
jgi:predicted phage baseplate assembly protein